MTTFMGIKEARELVKTYDSYVTPEPFMKALKKVDSNVYEDVMCDAMHNVEDEHADVYEKVEVQLFDDAEADKIARAKRAADMKAKRDAKRKGADAAKSEATVQQKKEEPKPDAQESKAEVKQEEKRGLSAQELVQQQRAQEQSVQQKQAQNQQSVQQKQDAQKQSVQTQKDDAHDAKPAQTEQKVHRPNPFGGALM